MGRVMAVDYGKIRHGWALSDESALIPTRSGYVAADPPEEGLAALVEVARLNSVELIVVGLPLHLSGDEGDSALAARSLAGSLAEATGLTLELEDERLTTALAERTLLSADMRRSKRKQQRDGLAASLILQSWLDRRRRSEEADCNG
jgi:putative Holliday junction resolvase